MSKALVIIKSMGIGDLVILLANIHAISKSINKQVVVLAQANTQAKAILKNDPYVEYVLDLDKKGIFNIINKIKNKNFDRVYIYSDSLRLYLISRLSGIKKRFQYKLFSKEGKNFFKTAKEFTEEVLNTQIDHHSQIFWDINEIRLVEKKFGISSEEKNIICGISASGPTKRWDVKNYIKLFENISIKFPCKFFIAAGPKDESLVNEIINSSLKNSCISFSKMTIVETMPIINACQYYIGNDTGWGQISAALNLKCLFLFCDSPSDAYGAWRKNIKIIVPEGEVVCQHNTRGKDKISYNEVLSAALNLIT
ncbi:MAG: ADP-heptose:LPS heptosyltransferase [Pelagibacterales bacterium]|jgi:ADP-heptose:LPS heptosyltransferase|nr:ADP-heptose:LPS heptosyltransferase [Pelagibacterales bacterium]